MEGITTSLKYLVSITKGRKPKYEIDEYEEGLIPYLSMDYLRGKGDNLIYVNEEIDSIVNVQDNDLLILWDGSKAGEIVYGKKGALSSTMAKLEIISNKITKEFLTYFLIRSQPQIQGATIGMGIPHVNGEDLRTLSVFVPNITTQIRVTEFLDKKSAEIDDIIEKKDNLLSLLEEKKRAIINEAVTKGIDFNVQMKLSGIEWIGEIPENWQVSKLKYITQKITDGAHISPDRSSEDKYFVSTVDINDGKIDFDGCILTSNENYEYLEKTGCKPYFGDVLYSKDGTIGKTAIVNFDLDFVVASSLIIIRPLTNKVDFNYLEMILSSTFVKEQVESNLSGVALRRVSLEKFSNLLIILPDILTQIKIVESVSQTIEHYRMIKHKLSTQIDKLKEYRQSLISEAVTGKIDI